MIHHHVYVYSCNDNMCIRYSIVLYIRIYIVLINFIMAKHDNSQKGYSIELYLNYIEYRVIIELIIVIDDNSHIGYSIVLNIYIKLIMAIHNNNSIVHIYNYIYI